MKDPSSPHRDSRMGVPQAPSEAPAPKVDALSAIEAAKVKLAKLRQDKELELLQAEIEKLENGGKSEGQIARERARMAIRAKTFVEELDGKKYAKYLIPERSYQPDMPGGVPRLREPGYITTQAYDTLPGLDWKPVQKVPQGPAVQFAAE